jgi:putative glutamine amidotransferase
VTIEQRPLIGITGRRKTGADLVGMPETLSDLPAYWYFADYATAVTEAGGLPVHLPFGVDAGAMIEKLDGVVFSGGADLDPAVYGQEPETDDPIEPERDDFEFALLAAAMERRTPVLGICRGLQLINVHAGGTLHQDLPPHARFDLPTNDETHTVNTVDGSLLCDLYGPSIKVNSLHHQGVDRLGSDLVVTASGDGDGGPEGVEGLEHTDLPVVAVQWHPEMLDGRSTDPIFSWLVDQARSTPAG